MSDKLKIQQERYNLPDPNDDSYWNYFPYKGYPDPINLSEVWSISDNASESA